MYAKVIVAASALLGAANAHFAIQQPVPIPGASDKSPLDPSGSNFPCQGADLSGGQVTTMAAGSSQPVKFNLGNGANWAVHGGGSCQISVTYETDKAKQKDPANWKVLHSWIGGCPTNAKGNLDPSVVACSGSDGTNCVFQDFTFTVPQEVKSGSAVLAWTWFNNIGNREMYMNCAKVSFTGGTGAIDTLPSMFAANIGNGCSTTETFNTDFPNPGKYVTKGTLNYPLKAGVGSCGSGSGSSSIPSSSNTGSTGTSGSSGSSGSSPAASAAASTTGRPKKGGTFAEGSTPTTLATVPKAAPTGTSGSSAPASNASSGSCSNGQVSCTATGFYCIDQSTFGLCNFGCATPMKMAAGTQCSGGAVARLATRHMRHRRHFFGLSV